MGDRDCANKNKSAVFIYEGRGAILIFDRQSLQCRWKVEPYYDLVWCEDGTDEGEEQIRADVIDIGKHLVGLVYDPATLSSARLRILNSRSRMETEAHLQQLIRRVPDWRYRPKNPVQIGICKHDLACTALAQGQSVGIVAEKLELPIGTVRRLAGALDAKRFFPNDLAAIVQRWCYRDFHKIAPLNRACLLASGPNEVINVEQLARVLGPDRLKILMQYSGLPRDELLGGLSGQLAKRIVEEWIARLGFTLARFCAVEAR